MQDPEDARAVRVGAASDGTLTYLVDVPPEALPPVRLRDLAAAWDVAREAAISAGSRSSGFAPTCLDSVRLFRFRRADGSCTDLALADRDALCWAGAVDRTAGMHTLSGLSVFLRLLALVNLLSEARWAAPLFKLKPDGAEIHPDMLQAAARAPLTREGQFDETGFRDAVGRDAPNRAEPHSSGARA